MLPFQSGLFPRQTISRALIFFPQDEIIQTKWHTLKWPYFFPSHLPFLLTVLSSRFLSCKQFEPIWGCVKRNVSAIIASRRGQNDFLWYSEHVSTARSMLWAPCRLNDEVMPCTNHRLGLSAVSNTRVARLQCCKGAILKQGLWKCE